MTRRFALSRLGRRIFPIGQRTNIRRPAVTALSTALLVAVLGAAPLPSAASPAATGAGAQAGGAAASNTALNPADVLPADGRWSVTLLTGEVVDVRSDADGRVTATMREGEPGTTLRCRPASTT